MSEGMVDEEKEEFVPVLYTSPPEWPHLVAL